VAGRELKQLFRAYRESNELAFRRAAQRRRSSRTRKPSSTSPLRATLRKILVGGDGAAVAEGVTLPPAPMDQEGAWPLAEVRHPERTFEDLVPGGWLEASLRRLIEELRQRERLDLHGLPRRQRLLLYGPPGCGKTSIAPPSPRRPARSDPQRTRPRRGSHALRKQTSLENLPFRDFAANEVWLELSLIGQDLVAWTKRLSLQGRARARRAKAPALPALPPGRANRPLCTQDEVTARALLALGGGARLRPSSASGRCRPRQRPERAAAPPSSTLTPSSRPAPARRALRGAQAERYPRRRRRTCTPSQLLREASPSPMTTTSAVKLHSDRVNERSGLDSRVAGGRCHPMKLKDLHPPPPLRVDLSWRELYEEAAFAQRELVGDSALRSAAKERALSLGIGQGTLEDLDSNRALRPVAFALQGYWRGHDVPAEDPATLRFVDELEPQPWKNHAWRSELEPDFDNVSALYSGWQMLYVDDVLDGTGADISLKTLVLPRSERESGLEQLRAFAERQNAAWRALDEAWRPTIKLLVALQNSYWPEISGRTAVVPDRDTSQGYLRAGPDRRSIEPDVLLERLGTNQEEMLATYQFLVERGLDRDPRDGLTLLRRARPRAFHLRWRGLPRRAQDAFDAAETIRRFLVELTGEQPERVPLWPLDGRQPERASLYHRGPGAPWTPEEIKEQLLAAELYPHGVHLIGEGESEQIVVERLVEATLGPGALTDLAFYDLGGSGSATQVEPLSQAFAGYAVRCLVIVDSEGQMADYLRVAIEAGQLEGADVLLFPDSLEAANAGSAELIDLARELGRRMPDGQDPVEFELTSEELDEHHADRLSRSARKNPPGKADTLLSLVHRRTEGRLNIDKLDFVESLAEMLVKELGAVDSDGLNELKVRRPIVGFVLDRLVEALNRPRPAGVSI